MTSLTRHALALLAGAGLLLAQLPVQAQEFKVGFVNLDRFDGFCQTEIKNFYQNQGILKI